MARLKYALFRVQTTAVFTIYEMDERFRAQPGNEYGNYYDAKNGISVRSRVCPELEELTRHKIFLRGTDNQADHKVCLLEFDTESDCEKYITRVNEALKEWAERWGGWEQQELKATKNSVCFEIKEV